MHRYCNLEYSWPSARVQYLSQLSNPEYQVRALVRGSRPQGRLSQFSSCKSPHLIFTAFRSWTTFLPQQLHVTSVCASVQSVCSTAYSFSTSQSRRSLSAASAPILWLHSAMMPLTLPVTIRPEPEVFVAGCSALFCRVQSGRGTCASLARMHTLCALIDDWLSAFFACVKTFRL